MYDGEVLDLRRVKIATRRVDGGTSVSIMFADRLSAGYECYRPKFSPIPYLARMDEDPSIDFDIFEDVNDAIYMLNDVKTLAAFKDAKLTYQRASFSLATHLKEVSRSQGDALFNKAIRVSEYLKDVRYSKSPASTINVWSALSYIFPMGSALTKALTDVWGSANVTRFQIEALATALLHASDDELTKLQTEYDVGGLLTETYTQRLLALHKILEDVFSGMPRHNNELAEAVTDAILVALIHQDYEFILAVKTLTGVHDSIHYAAAALEYDFDDEEMQRRFNEVQLALYKNGPAKIASIKKLKNATSSALSRICMNPMAEAAKLITDLMNERASRLNETKFINVLESVDAIVENAKMTSQLASNGLQQRFTYAFSEHYDDTVDMERMTSYLNFTVSDDEFNSNLYCPDLVVDLKKLVRTSDADKFNITKSNNYIPTTSTVSIPLLITPPPPTSSWGCFIFM